MLGYSEVSYLHRISKALLTKTNKNIFKNMVIKLNWHPQIEIY